MTDEVVHHCGGNVIGCRCGEYANLSEDAARMMREVLAGNTEGVRQAMEDDPLPLTDAEREDLRKTRMQPYDDGKGGILFREARPEEALFPAVERIIAARTADLAQRLADAERQRDEARRDRDHYGAEVDDLRNGNTYTHLTDRARRAEEEVEILRARASAALDALAAERFKVTFEDPVGQMIATSTSFRAALDGEGGWYV